MVDYWIPNFILAGFFYFFKNLVKRYVVDHFERNFKSSINELIQEKINDFIEKPINIGFQGA